MQFHATDEQVRQMCANAANTSSPAGMGFLRHDASKKFTAEDFKGVDTDYAGNKLFNQQDRYRLDYVQGRMVKLTIFAKPDVGDDVWEMGSPGYAPRGDYQSWCRTYPTWKALAESVPGVVIIDTP